MSEEDGAEKSFDATPQKLEEARKKGDLVKSADLNTTATYIGLAVGLLAITPMALERLGAFSTLLLDRPEELSAALLASGGSAIFATLLWEGTLATLLICAGPMVGAVVAIVAQNSFVMAPSKIEPKLSKISLLQNAKQKFGPDGIVEFLKSFAKLGIFSVVLVIVLLRQSDAIIASTTLQAGPTMMLMLVLLRDFLIVVVVISAAIGIIDYFWQRHSHLKKQMMTRQEVQDEHKKSEGDPHLKAKRRQRAQDIALNQMLQDVPEATVIIVNPTHYAVALKWSATDPTPPVCIAKGVDEVAARIREIAIENGVPIHRDPPTARALHAVVQVGAPIERDHFSAVAASIRFAEDMRRKAKEMGWTRKT